MLNLRFIPQNSVNNGEVVLQLENQLKKMTKKTTNYQKTEIKLEKRLKQEQIK